MLGFRVDSCGEVSNYGPDHLIDLEAVSGTEQLNAIFEWFRGAGGHVGDEDNVPVELRLGSGLFYVGIKNYHDLDVELSALLYLGAESTPQQEDQIEDVAESLAERAPDDVTVETNVSNGTDVWAAISLSEDDFEVASLGRRLRRFVDYSLRTMDEIQRVLHPLEILQPSPPNEPLTKLRQMVGVEDLVAKAEELVSLTRVAHLREREGLKASVSAPHLVFTGNPGTGKTTVARLMGTLFKELGLLESGHLVEARRSDLVGQFVGQTTPKTEAVIKAAMGGVLFIDEAYSLVEGLNHGRSFGEECITTLLLAMENSKNRFALIVAGYPEEMAQFVNSNPGLRSRFNQTWHFRDYTNEELVTIVERYSASNDYVLAEGCGAKLLEVFAAVVRDKYFGNARLARETFHSMKRLHAVRVTGLGLSNRADLMTIIPDDIQIDRPKHTPRRIGFSAG